MKVNIIDELSFTSFPLKEEEAVDFPQELLDRIGIDKKFDLKKKKIVDFVDTKGAALRRIEELKNALASTDYEAIKFAEGEMSEQDYRPFREQRRAWRAEINALETEIA